MLTPMEYHQRYAEIREKLNATLLWATTVFGTRNRLLEEDAFMNMVAREHQDGEHIKPSNSSYKGIGRSHFHSADE